MLNNRKGLITSTQDSRLNLKLIGYAVALLLVLGYAGQYMWGFGGEDDIPVAQAAELPTEIPTATPEIPTVTPTPVVIERVHTVPVEVTREVSRYVEVQVPVEVTRIVEVTPVPLPTATATPSLAAGTVRVCVDIEGAREVYVGGFGVVSGGCQTFSFGVGSTYIEVQVNK